MKNNKQKLKQKNNSSEEKRRLPRWIMILVLLLLLFIVLHIGMRLGSCKVSVDPVDKDDPNVPGLDPGAGEYVPPEQSGPAKGVAIPGWESLTIPANRSTDIIVDFYNPQENTGLYYLTFELRLPNDSEQGYEILYKSGLISPGLHIQRINLSRELAEGNYQAIIHVQPYRMADKSLTNNADMKTELIVR